MSSLFPGSMPMLPNDTLAVERVAALGGIELVRARFLSKRTPLHMHREVEIGVVLSGTRVVRGRSGEYLAPAGTIIAIPAGEVHAGRPADSHGSGYRAFLFPVTSLATVLGTAVVDALSFRTPVIRDQELASRLVGSHVAFDRFPRDRSRDADLLAIVRELVACYGQRAPTSRQPDSTRRVVERARVHLESNFAERVRLRELADLSGVSVFRLIRTFRAATGLTPYAYLEQVRVHRAAQLLQEGLGVSLVACVTGFADQSHLTRHFKRLVGIPPGRYRRQMVGDCPVPSAG